MKRRNFNKSILQQGGLMIEALAMLGLIAVVTPTMYKKSAERTMEVEDINTAATIRTINAAANDYVSANYSTILGDMVKNNETNRKLNIEDLKAYLPYGFDVKKALYNYDGEHIQLSVSRPDGSNNLTTLMLFPAKLDEENGIGQERTSRIAALIGSSGGYVTDTNKARGIGGIWELSGDSYTKNFNSANKYSIVTASADTISASAGNEMDYSKYLQRGKDPDDTGGQWKNTMRTDLYMGGPDTSTEDVYHEATGPWSIRNIKSLIVGANYGPQVTNDDGELVEAGGYGLYVTGDTNPNAYIKGSVEAGYGQLVADNGNLKYGKDAGTDDAGNSLFGFNVDTEGTITNLKNLNLAQKFTNGWNSIKIGALDDSNDPDYVIKASHDNNIGSEQGNLYLLGNVAEFHNIGVDEYGNDAVVLADGFNTSPAEGGDFPEINYNNPPTFPIRMGSNTKVDSLLAAGQIDTQKIRAASLSVGSHNIDDNEKWLNVNQYGVTMADIHHENNGDYDPQGTYASFNQAGILLRADYSSHPVSDDDKGGGANYKVGGQNTSEHAIQFNLRTNKEFAGGKTLSNVAELFANNTDIRGKEIARISGQGTIIQAKSEIRDWKDDYDSSWEDETQDFKDTVDSNTLLLRNDGMQIKMQTSNDTYYDPILDKHTKPTETVFSPRNNSTSASTRTSFRDMHVDLRNSNFKIVSDENKNIFSVRGNNYEEKFLDNANHDLFTRNLPNKSNIGKNIANNYDIALHGNIVVAPQTPNDVSASDADSYYASVSIGTLNKKAGVNILNKSYKFDETTGLTEGTIYGKTDDHYNIVMIDQGINDSPYLDGFNRNNNIDKIVDPGTVYIRKGYVEVHGEDAVPSYSYNDAYQGKGVLVASRLVANNPIQAHSEKTENGTTTNTPEHGSHITQFVNSSQYGNGSNRYDTYMVNPAYTSVMHDIKLTTRGGARLSDILPDFINKGIYVVSNTIKENFNNEAGDLEFNGYNGSNGAQLIASANSVNSTEKINFANSDAWASPYLGSVPAPQCPPGYGRVITLTPYSFEMAQAGILNKTQRAINDALSTGENGIKNGTKDSYYVMPVNNANEVKSSLTPPEYAKANVALDGNTDIKITATNNNIGTINGTLDELDGLSTQQYVLSSPTATDSSTTPVKPLFFQQSTRIKSATVPLVDGLPTSLETKPSALENEYVSGWAAIIGFIYPAKMYSAFTGNDNSGFYWNLFPVMRGTINGYATVYCYFDRTNMYGKYIGNYGDYVDKQDYMKTMTKVPSSKAKAADPLYKARLNDPNMKYDEVW